MIARVDAFLRPFLADFTLLSLAGIALARLDGKVLLLRHPEALRAYVALVALLSLTFAAVVLASRALAFRNAFHEPRGALWFLPFLHVATAYPVLHAALALPAPLFGPLWWCEATGLDLTRFQQFAGLLLTLLALNSLLSLVPAVGLYFRCHVIRRVSPHLSETGNRPFIGGAGPAIALLFAVLVALVVYIRLLSPDHYDWWRVRFGWRLTRDAHRAARDCERFLAEHPRSRFRENALFFLGQRTHAYGLPAQERADFALALLLRDHPESLYAPEALHMLAARRLRAGDARGALALAEPFANGSPRHPLADDLLALCARAASALGDTKRAAAFRLRLERDHPRGVAFTYDGWDRIVLARPTRETLDGVSDLPHGEEPPSPDPPPLDADPAPPSGG